MLTTNTLRYSASKAARAFVLYAGLSRILCIFNSQPRILMFHGTGTPDFPAEAFRAQLSFLSQYYRIVPLGEVCQSIGTHREARPRVALTFDDGLRNNFMTAYPILREFRVAATFFVCPGLINSRRWLWNHECRARLWWMSVENRNRYAKRLGLETYDVEQILLKLKYTAQATRVEHERIIREMTVDFRPTEEQHHRYDLMSWEELKAMDRNFVEIGGHSTNHHILTQLNDNQLASEVGECKNWLENELCRKVPHFCYPDGAYDTRVVSCVGKHFELAVTTNAGWVPPQPSILELPRIPIADNLVDLAWRMQRPGS